MKKLVLALTTLILLFTQSFAAKPFATQHWQTKNGAHVIFYQALEVPMLDISVAFAAGSAYDGDAFGLSALTTHLIDQGNNSLDANTVAEQLADTGAQFEAANNRDMIILNLKTLTKADSLKKATETFTAIINHPDFPESAFNREKAQLLMAIAQTQESPDEVAEQTFFQALYNKHPYAHPIIGTRDHVSVLTSEQVRHFYQQFFVGNNATIVMVGAIDQTLARQLSEQITQDLPKGLTADGIPKALATTEEMYIEVPFPSSQTVLRLGQVGINHHDPHYFPLQVGNYILGGDALASRLADELREKRGLTYGVSSQFAPMPGLGPFVISFSTKNSQSLSAIDITRKTLSSFLQTGPTEQELVAAKQYLTGSFPLSLASNRSIANMLLKKAFYHLPEDYLDTYVAHINAVTVSEIKEAFNQLIKPDKFLQVTVGKK